MQPRDTPAESSSRPLVFRVSRLVAWCGVIGILFCAYTALFAGGLTDVVLYPKVALFREAAPDSTRFCILMIAAGLVLIAYRIRVRLTITADSVEYRGLLCSRRVLWRDVTRIFIRPHRGDIDVFSGSRRQRLPGNLGDRRLLVKLINENAAHAVESSAQ